ncbi:hypothetical protein SAMN05660909_05473 [Chitinophaga terrae (ex Kim and Jung 2007)]|uniref:Phage integrase SAM-like domain-containing protein n=2 Tax=Chitinophaga TaxID=79328 RepID=A0A1H4GNI9_9BACT|nr:phage integrase SAM-like domain and Arm DNA-binding domain-containing protein [Chitinophaga terrae (ex Kim and Jung 2007)]GEP93566.1 hypothetical protein CTE07_52110 [Chitinophaga terrae (ex Kim and Jung 2007)]SEB10398.1 hypothetical protein SAMN05660909_05473 [Chitinophaga terrae (ex Kim and Jung 2007)]
MENRVDILFFAKLKKKNKKNLAPIYARLVVNHDRYEFSTGFSIDEKLWNGKAVKVSGDSQQAVLINNYINTKKLEVFKAYNELLLDQQLITLTSIKNKVFGIKEETSKTLLQLVDYHNTLFKSKIGTDTAITTYNKYKVTRRRLVDFLNYQYKKKDIYLNDLKLEFVASFDLYLKVVFKNSHNTVVKHCKNLKAIINLGIQYQWLEHNPFLRHKTPYKEGNKSILTKEELAILESKVFTIPRLQQVRDLFYISVLHRISIF